MKYVGNNEAACKHSTQLTEEGRPHLGKYRLCQCVMWFTNRPMMDERTLFVQ